MGVPIFLRLREYCATNCDPNVLDIIRTENNVAHFEEDEHALYKGQYMSCCYGRGCPRSRVACCDCCEPVEKFSVNDSYIRLEQKNCCYSQRSSVFLDWVYDLKLQKRCMCCCTKSCEHGKIVLYSFDTEVPELTIHIKKDARPIFDGISQRIDATKATRDHWLRSRTATVVNEAF